MLISKNIRQIIKICWSSVVIIDGAYLLKKITIVSPNLTSFMLPIYFLIVLMVLYVGHLLIEKITKC